MKISAKAKGHFFRKCLSALALLVLSCRPTPAEEPATLNAEGDQTAEIGAVATLAKGEPYTPLAVEADDATSGNADAPVTVVGYLDFECPFCAQGFATLLTLREEYSAKDLRVVFKHLPLRSHPQALPAAIAGQAVQLAAGSEAFFSFARLAFQNQSSLGYEELASYATQAGVSRTLYNEIVSDGMTVERVAQDARGASSLGVDSTPAFFINGRLLSGAQPIELFRKMIGEELTHMDSAGPWKKAYQARVTRNLRGSLVEALLAEDPDDYRVPVDGSAVTGPADAPVTLIAFTDFECPFCKLADVTVQELLKQYPSDLRVVFKHLPLEFHARARPAALLIEAVHQHKGDAAFYQAAKEVFERSPQLEKSVLVEIGKGQGLSKAQIDSALEEKDSKVILRLEKDRTLADDVVARGTPHFFINGKRLSGARPIEHFQALIENQLARARALEQSGTPAADVYETMQEKALSPGVPTPMLTTIPLGKGPSKGPASAPVVIHVFSDFECPYCRQGELAMTELTRLYPKDVQFFWHDFPLPFHEHALPAARAAREARKQKGDAAFWQMHNALFALDGEEARVTDEEILAHGKTLGLDVKKLAAAIKSDEHDATIQADMALAESLGIRGTPAYVIGDYLVSGVKPLNHLQRVVELAKARAMNPKTEK